jgi:adenosylhomocysteine nucleosidase
MSNAQPVLVCFALKEEASSFRKFAAARQDIAVIITGIGRRNTEKSVREFLATHSPARVLTCGFAGGLDPGLEVGAVLFETSDAGLRQQLPAAGAKPARFHCSERIATTAAEKRKLREETGADAVEMESLLVHQLCRERGIACASVRVISDRAGEDLPLDFNQLAKPDQSLDFGKLALAIAKSPGKIGALLRLQRQTRFAAERLAAVLAGLFPAGGG